MKRKGGINMWIEKLENSKGIRYKYNERFTNPKTNKIMRLSVVLNSINRQAQKIALNMLREKFQDKLDETDKANRQRSEKLDSLTFHQLADEWNEHTKPMIKIETYNNHTNYINRIKRAVPDDLHFLNFSPAMAEKIVNNMYYLEMLSFSYSNSTLIVIKNIMRYAKKAGYIYNTIDFDDIRLKKRPATEKELFKKNNKFLDRTELGSCLNQLKEINPRISLAMEFISLTGLRCGELLALREKDYNPTTATININGTIVKTASNGEDVQRGTPKNIYSYRDVSLNNRAKWIIEHFILENKQFKWHSKYYKNRGYIFITKNGFPYNIQYINAQLRKVHIAGKQLSTHIFRHTHISLLAELDVPLKAIMQRVGHNDPNTTLGIYTHVTDTMKAELDNKIKNLQVI